MPDRQLLHRRWTVNFFLLLVILTGVNGIFIYLVDPFKMTGKQLLEYDRKENNGNANAALWAMVAIEKINDSRKKECNVIIIGDSRGEHLTKRESSNVIFKVGPYKIFNLSFGGSSLEEMMSLFNREYQQESLPNLQKIIITVPFRRFLEEPKPDRVIESGKLVSNEIAYFFNYNILKRSLISLSGLFFVAEQTGMPAEIKEEKLIYTLAEIVRNADIGLFEQRLRNFETWISELKEIGVEVILWSPPVKKSILTTVQQHDKVNIYDNYVGAMEKSGDKFHDMFANAASYDLNFEFEIGDPVHSGQAESILGVLLDLDECLIDE